jgi:hypothetical protein
VVRFLNQALEDGPIISLANAPQWQHQKERPDHQTMTRRGTQHSGLAVLIASEGVDLR